jgi:hypothetical protein
MLLNNFRKSGGGGGGGGTYWPDISASHNGNPVSGDNQPGFTVGLAGTLNFSYAGASITYGVVKNGSALGQVASTTVAVNDVIYMTATSSNVPASGIRSGTITVSGLYSDVVNATLTNTSLS